MLTPDDKNTNKKTVDSENTTEQAIINDFTVALEEFDEPEIPEVTTDIEKIDNKPVAADGNIFEKKQQTIIKEAASVSAEKLLKAFNKTTSQILAAVLDDPQPEKYLPAEPEVKELAKELAVLVPDLHIGRGTGLLLAAANCYVPVTATALVTIKQRKNEQKSQTVSVTRHTGNGQNNTDTKNNQRN